MLEEKKLYHKTVLIVIASKDFRDEEYFIPYEIFQREGAKVVTASSVKGEIIGVEGGEARATELINNIDVRKYDAVVFVGGDGAREYFDNDNAHKIAIEAVNRGKILAAICIAPVILAHAGVLRAKKATVWSSLSDKSGTEELKKGNCNPSEERIVRDGKIITADGPAMAEEFAHAVVEAMSEKTEEKE